MFMLVNHLQCLGLNMKKSKPSQITVFDSDLRLQKSNCDFSFRETAGNKSLPLSLLSRGESQLVIMSPHNRSDGSHSAGGATFPLTYAGTVTGQVSTSIELKVVRLALQDFKPPLGARVGIYKLSEHCCSLISQFLIGALRCTAQNTRHIVPQWDFDRVLMALQKPPFEPLNRQT